MTAMPLPEPMTVHEFASLDADRGSELVRGRLVEVSRPTARHGQIVARLVMRVGAFVAEHDLGEVSAGDAGHWIERHPDTVRGPDVGFVRRERVPPTGVPDKFWEGAPDLAVEVVSPNDRYSAVESKTRDWLRAGAIEVWLVDFSRSEVKIVRADATHVFGGDDVLRTALLNGFEMPLRELFA